MEDTQIETQPEPRLAKASFTIWDVYGWKKVDQIWSPDDFDKLEVAIGDKEFHSLVDKCRFYYRRDPIAGTVVDKMVEIGITELMLDKNGISDNEFRIYEGIKDSLQQFVENCALEYLISGLVIPEISYASVPKSTLTDYGIKKYNSLALPVTMWLRDPKTIKIYSTMVMDSPSYFVLLPEELVWFITHEGTYPNGERDEKLYLELITLYPEFVQQVKEGHKEILLENDLIVRRRPLTDSPYPTPYLNRSLEAFKHKRNLRRMDYAIASRVISAIQVIRLGSDDYPLTEGEEDAFEEIKAQMTHSNSFNKDIDRIFQIFGNHTLDIEWVYPPLEALLDDAKYQEVNQDIFFGLGFPRILTTGETLRTGSSDPEFASVSPARTMENMQKDLISIVRGIIREIATLNGFKNYPTVRFSKINISTFKNFVDAMNSLYETGNISRTSYDSAFGYNWEDEVDRKEIENEMLKEKGLEEFSPMPFSNQPQNPQNNNQNQEKPNNNQEE